MILNGTLMAIKLRSLSMISKQILIKLLNYVREVTLINHHALNIYGVKLCEMPFWLFQ